MSPDDCCLPEKGVAGAFLGWHFAHMSMAELMSVVASLPAEQQRELAAFLLHLRIKQNPEWRADMGRRIDDHDPSHWTSLEDWKKELLDFRAAISS